MIPSTCLSFKARVEAGYKRKVIELEIRFDSGTSAGAGELAELALTFRQLINSIPNKSPEK